MANFDLKRPGVKEYVIVGGVVLGGVLLYRWYKSRNQTQAQAPIAADGAPLAPTVQTWQSPTGLDPKSFWLWLQDHATSSDVKPKPKPKPKHKAA